MRGQGNGNDNLLALQATMAEDFGFRYGWRVSDSFFTVEQLRRGVRNIEGVDDDWPRRFADHAIFYAFADGRSAAVAAHLYDAIPEEVRAWAKARGLRAAFPDFISWWNPPATRLVVYYAVRETMP